MALEERRAFGGVSVGSLGCCGGGLRDVDGALGGWRI